MQFDITDEERRKAKIPHEILLANLIGNHILWFIASLGIAKTYWQPVAMVPVISALILGYLFWRGRRARDADTWFVRAHWEICLSRIRVFSIMLALLVIVAALGWVGYTYFGMMDIAVKAIIGGAGILPVMVTVLVLIVMESDALHQAGHGIVPDGYVKRVPPPSGLKLLETE